MQKSKTRPKARRHSNNQDKIVTHNDEQFYRENEWWENMHYFHIFQIDSHINAHSKLVPLALRCISTDFWHLESIFVTAWACVKSLKHQIFPFLLYKPQIMILQLWHQTIMTIMIVLLINNMKSYFGRNLLCYYM